MWLFLMTSKTPFHKEQHLIEGLRLPILHSFEKLNIKTLYLVTHGDIDIT